MSDQFVLVERFDDVARVTLNRPERRNALNQEMVRRLDAAVAELAGADWCRAVVIAGSGPIFCAGGDLQDNVDDEPDPIQAVARHRHFLAAADRLLRCPKPTVAAVHGHAVGAGASLALLCDEIVLDRAATLRLAFLSVGLPPDLGSVHTLQRRIGWTQAAELLHSGRPIDGAEAVRINLVHEVADGDCLELAHRRAGRLAALSPFAFAATKALLRATAGGDASNLELLAVGIAAAGPDFREIAARYR